MMQSVALVSAGKARRVSTQEDRTECAQSQAHGAPRSHSRRVFGLGDPELR